MTTKRTREEFLAAEADAKSGRIAAILDAAIEEALVDGYQWISRDAVAERAGVSAGSVSNACGGMRALKRRVMHEAVTRPIPIIVAQGLADGSDIARNAPPAVKEAALQTLG